MQECSRYENGEHKQQPYVRRLWFGMFAADYFYHRRFPYYMGGYAAIIPQYVD
jgi:hypothetical protein